MYKQGQLHLAVTDCHDSEGDCENYDSGHDCVPRDARNDYVRSVPVAWLPHSCDAWVVGGPAEIRALISDLTAALEAFELGEGK